MGRHLRVPLFLYVTDDGSQLEIGFVADSLDALDVLFAFERSVFARCDDGLRA